MFLSLTCTSSDADASDLGYLVAKHPDRVQSFDLAFGTAWVYYPEATPERATIALQVEVDPIGLVRNRSRRDDGFALAAYVNDRPYAASSLLSVAIKRVFGSALRGVCQARPELVDVAWPLEVRLGAVPEVGLVRPLFKPLGWQVSTEGTSVTLTGTHTVSSALRHLYVLAPVLGGSKHYWVSEDEIDKLLTHASDWLPTHPERDLIQLRYLAGQRSLACDAAARLADLDDTPANTPAAERQDDPDRSPSPAPPGQPSDSLTVRRWDAVCEVLAEAGARRVVDVGCGEGALIRALLDDPRIEHITGLDVSASELARAERRLPTNERQRDRVTLGQSSLSYVDERLTDADAVVLMEVIEHLNPDRLADLSATVFALHPRNIVVTTPNAEYNALFERPGMRHADHRFEWTRAEFSSWAHSVAAEHGYRVSFRGIGDADASLGAPTQLAWFEAAA